MVNGCVLKQAYGRGAGHTEEHRPLITADQHSVQATTHWAIMKTSSLLQFSLPHHVQDAWISTVFGAGNGHLV